MLWQSSEREKERWRAVQYKSFLSFLGIAGTEKILAGGGGILRRKTPPVSSEGRRAVHSSTNGASRELQWPFASSGGGSSCARLPRNRHPYNGKEKSHCKFQAGSICHCQNFLPSVLTPTTLFYRTVSRCRSSYHNMK